MTITTRKIKNAWNILQLLELWVPFASALKRVRELKPQFDNIKRQRRESNKYKKECINGFLLYRLEGVGSVLTASIDLTSGLGSLYVYDLCCKHNEVVYWTGAIWWLHFYLALYTMRLLNLCLCSEWLQVLEFLGDGWCLLAPTELHQKPSFYFICFGVISTSTGLVFSFIVAVALCKCLTGNNQSDFLGIGRCLRFVKIKWWYWDAMWMAC